MQQHFKADLEEFFALLKNLENFALVRYGDGELAVINGGSVGEHTQAYQADGWSYEGSTDHPLSQPLRQSLNHTETNYYYGFPCQCCNDAGKNEYLRMILCGQQNITFANLFINGNYKSFLTRFSDYLTLSQRPCVLMATAKVKLPAAGSNTDARIQSWNWADQYLLPENAVEAYRVGAEAIEAAVRDLAGAHQNAVFIFALGPLAEVLIDSAYRTNPHNVYLDVGSALDELFYGRKTRPYQQEESPYHKDCTF